VLADKHFSPSASQTPPHNSTKINERVTFT
jgi:hypothetical protein